MCHAGCLPRKELYEAWEVARRVRRLFRGGRVVDLAGGHGLLATIMLLLDDSSPGAIVIDTAIPDSAAKLAASLEAEWPKLSGRMGAREQVQKRCTIVFLEAAAEPSGNCRTMKAHHPTAERHELQQRRQIAVSDDRLARLPHEIRIEERQYVDAAVSAARGDQRADRRIGKRVRQHGGAE